MAFAKKNGMTNGESVPAPAPREMPKRETSSIVHDGMHTCCTSHRDDFGRKILFTLVGVFLVYAIFYVGTLLRNNLKKYDYIGQADQMERTISINGYGKVTASNDVAMTTIRYSNIDKDVGKAQVDNNKVMDQIVAALKNMGVDAKDMQSNYTIFPEYNYTPEKGQELKGYRVNNTVMVKIRDLSKVSSILGLAGKFGSAEVDGLSFTIDDTENLKQKAREAALEDAQLKAARLADDLGVRLVGVVSYSEYEAGPEYNQMYGFDKVALERGGASAPISSGSGNVVMNVGLVYKIFPR
ncbi:MAG TPA: SIMPL domain-containing protein [Patescibacteria group bacterium]|nr:SIMPL domain-containing protein [Patescibacteria group bacterium]